MKLYVFKIVNSEADAKSLLAVIGPSVTSPVPRMTLAPTLLANKPAGT